MTLHDFMNDMVTDFDLVESYFNDPKATVEGYGLAAEYVDAVASRDITALADLGVNAKVAEIAMSGLHRTFAFPAHESEELLAA